MITAPDAGQEYWLEHQQLLERLAQKHGVPKSDLETVGVVAYLARIRQKDGDAAVYEFVSQALAQVDARRAAAGR